MKSLRVYILSLVLCVGLGFCGGVLFEIYSNHTTLSQRVDVAENDSAYTFIDPLLFCQDQNISNQGASDLQQAVQNYMDQEENDSDIIDGAFYFKDLNGGPWAVVNPGYQSAPGSLLKIPIALAAYHRAEADPTFLAKKIAIPATAVENANQNEHFAAPVQVEPNTSYTVSDLIRLMLQYSDNNALNVLGNLFTFQQLQSSYSSLGIVAPTASDQDGGYTMGVETLASFFRVLYSATYLNREDSEQFLSILSQSSFTQGIVAGLPSGTLVSHKFGEYDAPDGTIQLNDCGIVYKPDHPYLVCILTKGTSFDALTSVISHISQLTYNKINTAD